jgi:two-component system, chemotaxis family, chemotaxis protein CheY
VVEDDADIRETLQLILELEGYAISTAGNGLEALEILRSGVRPGLILLDLMMPVMGGWEFLELVQREPRLAGIPVVLVTAFADRAGNLPVKAVIPKPIEMEEMLRLVAKWTGASDGG